LIVIAWLVDGVARPVSPFVYYNTLYYNTQNTTHPNLNPKQPKTTNAALLNTQTPPNPTHSNRKPTQRSATHKHHPIQSNPIHPNPKPTHRSEAAALASTLTGALQPMKPLYDGEAPEERAVELLDGTTVSTY